ncbi:MULTISPECIES: hypothetical protein [Alteromonas]|jgi:hypothetical protein|uniref:Uncharacterized protein n=1 Tax=Alteromonas stellipolaris TaxID=233316 RepID=A0ABN4LHW1_9ALTE|nr:hypothetical protein [Alteromonas stellipolaris]ALM91640.1 hypothetical protein AOR13_2636 [Alteromonas stellipolaris LMG 21856]AMJ73488.1 hypothetical protein AVL57_05560 [Alteromonas stellipolaris]
MDRILAVLDSARTKLGSGIKSVEQAMSESLGKPNPALAQEIRAHIKTLDRTAIAELVQKFFAEKNYEVVNAIIDAPAFLSGITTEERENYKRKLHETTNPELVKRVKVMKSALSIMESRGPLVMV